jgi:hypothetical protein
MNNWKQYKIDNNIKYVSIIIYAISNNHILLLLGKESKNGRINKTDYDLYSEFWDKLYNDENIVDCASRILFEKTMNLIIDPLEFEKLINESKIQYTLNNNTIIFLFKIDYDKHKLIPDYYNKFYSYLLVCSSSNSMEQFAINTCPIGFFDKSELVWIHPNTILDNYKIYKKKFLYNLMKAADDLQF